MAKASKYAHVVGSLPKFLGEDQQRLDLLNQLRTEILTTEIDEDNDYNLSAQIVHNLKLLNVTIGAVLYMTKKCPQRNASGLARAYADARFVLDAINEWKSSAQLLVDAYERMMTDQMELEDVKSIGLTSGASVSTYVEPYGKVIDPAAFRAWCVANGYESKLQLWPSTMNAIAKERTLTGVAPPDGVEVTAKTQVRLNKA